jgi:hypothetical protein
VGCLLESFGCLQRSRAERCDSACGIDILDFPKASRVLIDSGACSQGGQPKKLTMNTLPDDLLCRCLARVPLADRVPAERVCSRWRTAFASRAYTVARHACAEPVWLVMGGMIDSTELSANNVLDVSLRKVAELAPRFSFSAGSAVIPGLGILVMGGQGADRQHTRTARVLNLQGGSAWGVWGLLPDSCTKPSICALGESIYVECCYDIHSDAFGESELLRYDKQGNLLETIQKPAAIRRPIGDAPVLCAINGRLFLMTRVDDQDSIYRLDSYNPATGAWQRMPDPPIQGFGLNNGAVAHAGKLYAIGGNAPRITGGRELVSDVRVFDGREWSTGPPLPTPEFCNFAVSAGDRILVVVDNFRRAYVLHNGTWHSHSCEETELIAFPRVVPMGSALAGHIA